MSSPGDRRHLSTFSSTVRVLQKQQANIIDLLRTSPSALSFAERVKKIGLSPSLESKILTKIDLVSDDRCSSSCYLTAVDEKELAGEVLLLRHAFTRSVFENSFFRQAALTIIQNIYLFRQRRIFFGTSSDGLGDQERQEALLLFSSTPEKSSIPLAKTFQHLILARVWDRIINQASETFLDSRPFTELHEIVEQLNTLRNIYMLLSMGLVRKMTENVGSIYRQSITREDACQIGNFGIARAAYRYHPSSGLRFSTYASYWIRKEIQRQSLNGRLIRISSNLVERISREAKGNSPRSTDNAFDELCRATAQIQLYHEDSGLSRQPSTSEGPAKLLEKEEARHLLKAGIVQVLSPKARDVIMRRYGLGPYHGNEQSVIAIAEEYGVTRGSIYQLEQTALCRLKRYLAKALPKDTYLVRS